MGGALGAYHAEVVVMKSTPDLMREEATRLFAETR
jgi:hypothetical protein